MLNLAKTNKQYKFDAALFSYLVPCYLAVFAECNKGEAKGVVFFSLVVQQLLTKSSTMLDDVLTESSSVLDDEQKSFGRDPIAHEDHELTDLIAELLALQNKVNFGLLLELCVYIVNNFG